MHELAITQGILDIAVKEATSLGKKSVTRITIKNGVFSGMVPECIQEYYDILSEGTIAEHARLVFEKIPGIIHCEVCGTDSELDRFRLRCPKCGENRVSLVSGRVLYVDSMEVEDGD